METSKALDYEPRPRVRSKKGARDRLIRFAQQRPDWVLGFVDEVWWSRFAQPSLHAWCDPDDLLRLIEQVRPKNDPDPKALACYGILTRWVRRRGPAQERVWLRFVRGRPVSAVTVRFLAWVCHKISQLKKRVFVLIWDNASWHISAHVRQWIRQHNRQVKQSGRGVRIIPCPLPTKSPWLNPIEPKWVHTKRRVVEPNGLLSANELATRVCDALRCPYEPHLIQPVS